MIGALLASLLAVAAVHDTTSLVPGTTVRFGAESGRFGAAQGFQPTAQQQPPGRQERVGAMRFFGIDARATLEFLDRRLVEADFVIESASPQQIAYIGDDMVRRGYHRRCTVLTRQLDRCTWLGETHVEMTREGGKISAKILPLTAEERAVRQGPPATPPPTSRDTVLADGSVLPIVDGYIGCDPPGDGNWVLVRTPPRYPDAARKESVQGTVMLQALVDTAGAVIDVRVVRSIAELDSAAITAVRTWRFRPATRDGHPVGVWTQVPVRFLLH